MTTFTVSAMLVFILVGGRFLKYMEEAAEGRIAGELLLSIMLFRVPNFLEMILPLGLFLGILLAYGRLYTDNEMYVLQTAGLGNRQLLKLTIPPVMCMMLAVGALSLWLGPVGLYHSEHILESQKSQSGLNVLTPGRFHGARHQDYVIYVEAADESQGILENVYMVQRLVDSVVVVAADSGHVAYDMLSDGRLLRLQEGYRYEGGVGQADFSVIEFAKYETLLDENIQTVEVNEQKALSTALLFKMLKSAGTEKEFFSTHAELQWRLSLPFLVPIIACIAIPLSRVSPRQGRYVHIFPSILIYLAYLSVLSGAKNAVELGRIPVQLGLWWVHLLFILVATALFSGQWFRRRRLLSQSA